MARKKIKTTWGGRTLPDSRTKIEILKELDITQDALSAAIDAQATLAKSSTDLHDRIQHQEAVEDGLKQQLTQMRGQRDQLLDAIEDFEEADHESMQKAGQRDVAYARMSDLHSEIGTERSNEMVADFNPGPVGMVLKYNEGDGHWRQHKGAGT